jgi:hypothetical protein
MVGLSAISWKTFSPAAIADMTTGTWSAMEPMADCTPSEKTMKAAKSEPDILPCITIRPPSRKTAAVRLFWTSVTSGT